MIRFTKLSGWPHGKFGRGLKARLANMIDSRSIVVVPVGKLDGGDNAKQQRDDLRTWLMLEGWMGIERTVQGKGMQSISILWDPFKKIDPEW
jgi:hypothetical protein